MAGGAVEQRPGAEAFAAYRADGGRDLRDQLVLAHLGLARSLAGRYVGRGVAREDLEQVATVGLVKAVTRFDPDRGTAFSSYAVPMILGELRHHFRDRAWTISVPRRLQELRRRADHSAMQLAQRLHRQPTLREVALDLGEEPDNVLLALEGLRSCFRPGSFDGHEVETTRDVRDDAAAMDTAVLVAEMLEQLPQRERTIVVLRYWHGQTQQEIADRVGCSQMHVSRLLRRAHDRLRQQALAGDG